MMENYERDLAFYTGLQHQAKRGDTPDILKKVLVAYENHMARTYNVKVDDLRAQSAVLHYERENKITQELAASGELEKMLECDE